ncbi:TPA_asm: hypothetical protein GYV56_12500 [Listeria monocytogenes]|uniref:hypothetical protein n=1 Tax=Listeria monocytogenes TaxID=1639 RepID=UPI00086F4B9B|nr:hypothetical protein [Listeria monocytogenes]EAE4828463.1 hypothetical protein [Listeria monocytogenes]EAE5023178.1 hypothetical protein [Listeria monocytogenes]EAG6738022.1 hypothetical protein [Listeria monocytogenes]EED2333595.1 hypothetical protein [Listeria monocytogenes]EHP7829766.1 hypothetical protein [Listeria monocytogenes]
MFKRLLCYHDFKLISATEWSPSVATLNGRANEDERTLRIKCAKCNKKKRVTQTKSNGKIVTHVDITGEGE